MTILDPLCRGILAFCLTVAVALGAFTAPVSGQTVDDYRYYSWNPTDIDWDYDTLVMLEAPTSGDFYESIDGNFYYESNNPAQTSDSFLIGLSSDDCDCEITVDVDKTTGDMFLSYKGNGKPGDPPGGNPPAPGGNGTVKTFPGSKVTGTVVGQPGTNAPVGGGTVQVFVTDDTATGDSWHVWWDLGGCGVYHNGTKDWDDVSDGLSPCDENSIDVLVISGHGAHGGCQSSGGDVDSTTITPTVTEVIKDRLKPTGTVVILGCGQATGGYSASGCQDLADTLGVPVIGNGGCVSGSNGDGTWYQFDPKILPAPPVGGGGANGGGNNGGGGSSSGGGASGGW